MTRPPQRKRGQGQKSKPKQARSRPNENADPKVGKSSAIPLITPNVNDSLVIQKLITRTAGLLAVDSLVLNPQQSVPELRLALVNVYLKAATQRQLSKATKSQLKNAKSALSQWTQVLKSLERVSTDGRDGLRMLLEGPPLDDNKGERELNEFASVCWQIRMDATPLFMALQSAINTEENKQTNVGERPKRLRTLVEALADWWQSTGGTLAPTVDANRRDDGPAVVHGRHGPFLTLAVALFCEVDVFEESEVVSAVTNVHEKRLAPTPSAIRD
jgi:hypothetical protein